MRYDVMIIGAGMAGMTAMLRMAAAGFSVIGIERGKPQDFDPQDLRSTAFLMPSIEVLKRAEIWDALQPHATALDIMEIVDAAQKPPKSLKFDAREIGQAHFGFNLINSALHRILRDKLNNHKNVKINYNVELSDIKQFYSHIEASLSDGNKIEAQLVIGAEGRASPLRERLGIAVKHYEYDQWAQVFTTTHTLPHENISTEIHAQGGPFTLVPRDDVNGLPASAVVWMDRPEEVKRRKALSAEEFNGELNARALGWRGEMKLASALGAFPMISMEAAQLHDHRALLIGESAHVVPPIGAQGLNMSLRDIESLVRALETGALKKPDQLKSWAQKRRSDIAIRRRGIDALNKLSIAGFNGATGLRQYGLNLLDRPSSLRRGLMRMGLGK